MKLQIGIVITSMIGTIAACSSYRIVRNQTDEAATWSTYQTFAFVDTTRQEQESPIAYRRAMEQARQSVTAELQNRGYRPLLDRSAASPDLLVNIGAVVNEKTQTRETTIYEAPRYIGQRRYSWRSQEVPVGTYQEGTINVHVVDSQRNSLVWDAAVSGVLSKKGVTPEQIDEAVAKLFEKFPGKR
jgi:hypothetical protein